jgi:biotin carboxyl carrier protein
MMKYTVRVDEQTYQVEIESLSGRPIIARIGNTQFEIWPEAGLPEIDETISTRAARAQADKIAVPPTTGNVPSGTALNVKEVSAPLPGVILEVKVKPKDSVEFGQVLFIIEAMKMRNAIRASRPGEVAEIFVSPGQTVNHNDRLMTFSE